MERSRENDNLIKSLIGKGETKEALALLVQLSENRKLKKKEVLTLKAKFERLSDQFNIGIIEHTEFDKEINKVNYGIMQLEETIGNITVSPRKFNLLYLLPILLLLIGVLYFVRPGLQKYELHLYQLSASESDSKSYNESALKHLISELNSQIATFEIILYPGRMTVNLIDFMEENYSKVIEMVDELHDDPITEQEVVAVLVDFPLNSDNMSNFFSLTGPKYAALSVWGLQAEGFASGNYDSFILRYIVTELVRITVLNRLLAVEETYLMHPEDQFKGCLFDFMRDKTEIVNSIESVKFCPEHKEVIKKKLGIKVLNEYEEVIQFNWIDDEVKAFLSRQYDITI